MKKYDIALLIPYILIIIGTTLITYKVNSTVVYHRAELYELIQNQDIDKVVISGVNTPIEIFTMPIDTLTKWKLSGRIEIPDDIGKIYIANQTLYINGEFKGAGTRVLKLRENITIDIIDSPKTRVFSYDELQKRLNNKKIKSRYAF